MEKILLIKFYRKPKYNLNLVWSTSIDPCIVWLHSCLFVYFIHTILFYQFTRILILHFHFQKKRLLIFNLT